ncbi:phage holin, LLH family [Paenibacillus nuruki]|uniref:phage holin, LLH family n=1 Tax=Paenibacillus nuruki TaxID=1886670 RepID=UPI00280629AE|nr:phage holin, LLH family [Paenibacillus nuruki]CAJ1315894.1 hypothetical protein AASFL403_11775 [Paenibacillus nuruki]
MNWNPILTNIYAALLFILALAVIYGIFYGLNYLRTKSKNQKVTWLAEQAYVVAEKWGKYYLSGEDDAGARKAQKAYEVMSSLLKLAKISLTSDQIKYLIELAWHKLEGIPKVQGSTAVINTEIAAPQEALEEAAEKVISKVFER